MSSACAAVPAVLRMVAWAKMLMMSLLCINIVADFCCTFFEEIGNVKNAEHVANEAMTARKTTQ